MPSWERSHRNQGRACRGNRGRQSGSYREKYKNGIKLSFMKIGIIAAALAFVGLSAVAQTNQKTNMDMKKLELVQEWDKTFPKSDKVEHSKVVFVNRFGVTLAADMYVPKEVVGKLSAVAVSGPFGAVKEQSSGLYAQALAERGFLTMLSIRRSRGRAAVCPATCFARHQYGRFQRSGRFSRQRRPCGSGTYRDPRYMRLGWFCHQRCR